MKRILTLITVVLLLVSMTLSLTSCDKLGAVKEKIGEIMQHELVVKLKGYAVKFFDLLGIDVGQGRPHQHKIEDYAFNDHEHWSICECGERGETEAHKYNEYGKCRICGYSESDHIHVLIKKPATEPTCTKAGNIEYWECEQCGNLYGDPEKLDELAKKEVEIAAIGHAFGEFISGEDGTHTRVCANDPSHTETGDCSGGEATCSERAVCETCKGEYGSTLDHAYLTAAKLPIYLASPATCDAPAEYYYSCACGAKSEDKTFIDGEALGHAWTEYTSNGEGGHTRVCLNDRNHTETVACSGGEKSCTDKAICDVCHEEYGDSPNHNWDNGTVTKEAKCAEAGNTKYTCLDCGEIKNAPISIKGHAYGSTVVKPDCTVGGYTEYVCTECGDTYRDEETEPQGHSWDKEKVDCVSGRECTECGETEAPLGHSYKLTESNAAACEIAGSEKYTCEYCGDHYENQTAEPLVHTPEGSVNERLIEGETCLYVEYYVCKHCGNEILGETVEHHDLKASIVREGSCSTEGSKKHICSLCDYSYSEPIPIAPDNHVWDAGTVNGSEKIYACTEDGCSATRTVVVAENGSSATVGSSTLKNELEFEDATLDLGGISSEGGVLNGKENLTVSAGKLTEEELLQYNVTVDQLAQIGTSPVYNFTILDGEEAISDFGEDGYVTITIPYDITGVEDVNSIAIWYISNDTPVSIPATYSNGYVTFKTNHFSVYTVTLLSPAERCALYDHVFAEKSIAGSCVVDTYVLKTCLRCSYSEKEISVYADGHDFVVDTTHATCTEHGTEITTCRDCDYRKTVTLFATGHSYEVTEDTAATCAAKGVYTKVCATCGDTVTRTYPQLPHKLNTEKIAPTCESAGYTHRYCSECDYSQKSNYVDAKGHSISAIFTVSDDKSTAEVVIECKNCDLKFTNTVNAEVRNIETGCTVKREYIFKQIYNGETYTEKLTEETSISAHDFGTEYKFDKDCHFLECRKCGERKDETPHLFSEDGIITVYPTCDKPGERAYACECGAVKTEVIEKTGKHVYVDGVCTECGKAKVECDHTVFTPKSIDLSTFGTCNGVILYEECECGEVKRLADRGLYSLECNPERDYVEEEYTDADGNACYKMSAYCESCELYVEVIMTRKINGCVTENVSVYTFKVGDVTVIEGLVESSANESHDLKREVITVGGDCVCGGRIEVEKCADCGKIVEANPMIDCEDAVYSEEEFKVEDGQGRKMSAVCATCGHTAEMIETVVFVTPCKSVRTVTLNVYVGEELFFTFTSEYENVSHNYEQRYELKGDTCADGYTVYITCLECGEQNTSQGYGHAFDKGVNESLNSSCGGHYGYSVCRICGERGEYDFHLGCFDEGGKGSSYTDKNGIEHYVVEHECDDCGFSVMLDKYSYDEADCRKVFVNYYIVYDDNGDLVCEFEQKRVSEEHDYEVTYVLDGEDCEDGWTVTYACRDCGYTYYYSKSGHNAYSDSRYVSDGVCGFYAEVNVCSICDKIVGGRLTDTSCHIESFENSTETVDGVTYEISTGTCKICGAVYTRRSYRVYDGTCYYNDYTEESVTSAGGEELICVSSRIFGSDHDLKTEMGSGNCEEGFYFTRCCTKCDYQEEGYSYGHLTETNEVDLGALGLCGGYAKVTVCTVCGYNEGGHIESKCNYEYIHDNPDKMERMICTVCGSERRTVSEIKPGRSECEKICSNDTVIYLDGEEIFRLSNQWYSYNHKDVATFKMEGKDCEDGFTAYLNCTVCGRESTEYSEWHNTYPVWRLDLSDRGVCGDGEIIVEYSCACGSHGNADLKYCGVSTGVNTYVENGTTHTVETWYCESCGLELTSDSFTERDGCALNRVSCYTVSVGGEVIVSDKKVITSSEATHKYVYSFRLYGEDCEDGYDVYAECELCGHSYETREVYGHGSYETEKVYFSEYGACGGMFRVSVCACGKYNNVEHSIGECDKIDYTENTYEQDGILYYVETYNCRKCGLRSTLTRNYEYDVTNCTRISHNAYVINVGGELAVDYDDAVYEDWHDIEVKGTLLDPNGSCDSGVLITEECKNCDYSSSNTVYYHEMLDVERFDLRQYGAVCGGSVVVRGCACGRFYDVEDDHALCKFDRVDVDFNPDIDNFISGTQMEMGTENMQNYYYPESRVYTCAVTDPDPCGIRYSFTTYWLYEGDCTARMYVHYSIGCDSQGKDAVYENTIATSETQIYHILEHEFISDSVENDKGEIVYTGDCTERTYCVECGSYYQVKNESFENGPVSYIEVTSENTLSVGEYKYYIRTSESSDEHYEYHSYPIVREYTKQVYMDGREYWEERVHTYSEYNVQPFGPYMVKSVETNSNGYYRETASSYYEGYGFTLYDHYYEDKNDLLRWWCEYDYTYDFTGECRRTVVCVGRDEEYTRVESAHPSFYHKYVEDPSCTQFGVAGYYCYLCDALEDAGTEEVYPSCHRWIVDNRGFYVCITCGMQNLNGASGDIVMEDFTDKYGNGEYYVAGYYNRSKIEFLTYISILIGGDPNNEIILQNVEVMLESDKYVGAYASIAQIAAAAEALGYKDGEYLVKLAFVPLGSDGSHDYAVTFTGSDFREFGSENNEVTTTVGDSKTEYIKLDLTEDGRFVFAVTSSGTVCSIVCYDAYGSQIFSTDIMPGMEPTTLDVGSSAGNSFLLVISSTSGEATVNLKITFESWN